MLTKCAVCGKVTASKRDGSPRSHWTVVGACPGRLLPGLPPDPKRSVWEPFTLFLFGDDAASVALLEGPGGWRLLKVSEPGSQSRSDAYTALFESVLAAMAAAEQVHPGGSWTFLGTLARRYRSDAAKWYVLVLPVEGEWAVMAMVTPLGAEGLDVLDQSRHVALPAYATLTEAVAAADAWRPEVFPSGNT